MSDETTKGPKGEAGSSADDGLELVEWLGNFSGVCRRGVMDRTRLYDWKRVFHLHGLDGLKDLRPIAHDELRPGKPRSIDDEQIAGLLTTTLHQKPKDGATHWSVRGLAAETGISKTSVHRFLRMFGLQPHRQDTFKLSTDPFFVEKLRDVVGLYLDPPDKALVLCVDEKARCRRSSAPSRCCPWL